MEKYVCQPCGYVYDPENGDPDGGIAPGTAFEDLPDDWLCPICGMGKRSIRKRRLIRIRRVNLSKKHGHNKRRPAVY